MLSNLVHLLNRNQEMTVLGMHSSIMHFRGMEDFESTIMLIRIMVELAEEAWA